MNSQHAEKSLYFSIINIKFTTDYEDAEHWSDWGPEYSPEVERRLRDILVGKLCYKLNLNQLFNLNIFLLTEIYV